MVKFSDAECETLKVMIDKEINNLKSVADRVNKKEYWLGQVKELESLRDKVNQLQDVSNTNT